MQISGEKQLPTFVISKSDLQQDLSSYVDPQGYLFHYDGGIYRFIRGQAAPLFEGLMADGTLDRLTRECPAGTNQAE